MTDFSRLQGALSSIRREQVYLTAEECPSSLLQALAIFDPARSVERWHELLARGSVYVNGRRIMSEGPLPVPCRIELFDPAPNARPVPDKMTDEWLIYRDEDLAIVWKPPGLSTMPAREQRYQNLKVLIEEYLGMVVHLPSRLDASTQGLVLVSLSARMHRTMQRMFDRRSIEKHYLAFVAPAPAWDTLTVSANIDRDPEHAILRRVVPEGGQSAVTRFICRERRDDGALLSAYLETGRTHQIRVHCQHLGCPVVGDDFYDGRQAEGLCLLAYELAFWQPYVRQDLRIRVPDKLLPMWAMPISTHAS